MKEIIYGRNFWRQAAERAGKSAAQAAIGLIPLGGFNLLNVDWKLAIGVAGGAAVLSFLTSIVTAGVGQKDDPSIVSRV